MKVFMFPGQGSQAKGMGGALFDEFKELADKADKILGYSIKELCLDDPRGEIGKTQFTQPALYVVNAFSYLKKIKESGARPDFVLGHSLGEFNALFAAECFDFEDGLRLVKKRGELMSQAADGGMAAILNASKEKIEEILEKNGLNNIDLVNFNTPSQIVISGLREEINRAQPCFREGGMVFHPLNTSGAFHSRFMQPAKEKFEAYLKKFKLSEPKIPVISNVTARPYRGDEVLDNLSRQIASPVRWCESVQFLMETGEVEFEEIGHGQVLTNMVQKIRKESPHLLNKGNKEIHGKATGSIQTGKLDQKGEGEGIRPEAAENARKEKAGLTAQEKVDFWNGRYTVGTKVKSTVVDYGELETRTEAVVLFGHRAAVYMKGYNGYFDLDEVKPL